MFNVSFIGLGIYFLIIFLLTFEFSSQIWIFIMTIMVHAGLQLALPYVSLKSMILRIGRTHIY